MNDTLTPDQRSWVMGRVRSKNTQPELIVRSILHRMGYRFRINRRDLPGKPDIVLPKHKTVVFVHGCFWHRHRGCKNCTTPSTRREYWEEKFARNVQRDRSNRRELRAQGWKVIVAWECDVRRDPAKAGRTIAGKIDGPAGRDADYPLPTKKQVLKAAEQRMRYGLDGGRERTAR